MDKNTVLSLSRSSEALKARETVLRNGGLNVISVSSPIEARYEITMGRCGVLLICYRLNEEDAQEITKLYKANCPQGLVIFVEEPSKRETRAPQGVDFVLSESAGPQRILQTLKG